MNIGGKPEDKSTHNPCALPAVTQVIVAAKGVTDPLIQSIRKFGSENNFKAGRDGRPRLGFGPFGHDFGSSLGNTLRVQGNFNKQCAVVIFAGSSVIPGAVDKVQSCFAELMMKFAIAQKVSGVQGILPASVKSGITMLNDTKDKSAIGSIKEMAKSVPENISRLGLSEDAVKSQAVPAYKTLASKGLPSEGPYSSRAEKVIDGFLKNPVLDGEDNKANDMPRQNAERLQSDNLLKMVLNHQQVIEELLEENMKLRKIMVEDLKISPSKLQGSCWRRSTSSSAECFGNDTGTINKSTE